MSTTFNADTGGIGGHPRGLTTLFFTEFWERFSYYGMRAILTLFMGRQSGGWGTRDSTSPTAAAIYGFYTAAVSSWASGRLDRRPAPGPAQCRALRRNPHCVGTLQPGHRLQADLLRRAGVIVLGTGLLKPNISAIVGQLYSADDNRRDAGFSIFYIGINMGAFLSPLICGTLAEGRLALGIRSGGSGDDTGPHPVCAWRSRLGHAGFRERSRRTRDSFGASLRSRCLRWSRCFTSSGTIGTTCCWPDPSAFLVAAAPGKGSRREEAYLGDHRFLRVRHAVLGRFRAGGIESHSVCQGLHRELAFGWQFPASYYQSVNPLGILVLAPLFCLAMGPMGQKAAVEPREVHVRADIPEPGVSSSLRVRPSSPPRTATHA